ncbi:MAG: hypothetical protein IPJ99_19590 [Betaproteobacteria bacterium]|nr:hypothetical protein [Betaproteobacteria bacterium]
MILISLGASYFPDDPAPKKEPAAAAPLASDSGKATGIAEGSKAVESSRGAEKSATSKTQDSAAETTAGSSTLPPLLRKIVCWFALLLGGWWFLWWCLRYRLWKEYWHLGEMANGPTPKEAKKRFLLGSQEPFVARMAERLQSFGLDQPGPLYAIQGGWGSGKSFLMAELQARLQANPDIASVYAHVWREQTACDLHLALVDTILADHKILKRCFSAYSNRFVIHKLGDDLRRYLPRGLQFKNSVMEATIDPTQALPMLAQREFEKVVACAVRSGLRIVICLDEIDRSTPAVAQAAIVMTRRALGLKGLAILLPYVDVQLSHKVFNPLNDYSPDLHQTFLVSLDSQHSQPVNEVLRSSDDGTGSAPATVSKDAPAGTDSNAKTKVDPSNITLFAQHRRSREAAILQTYASLHEDERVRIQHQNEEKYLSLKEHVPTLAPSDLPKMLIFETVFRSLRKELANELKTADLLNSLRQELISSVPESTRETPSARNQDVCNFVRGLDLLAKSISVDDEPGSRLSPPAIRHVEGRLVSMLGTGAPGYRWSTSELPFICEKLVVAATICVAWRESQRLAHKKG